ncbi:hypothetical protein SLS55_000603 [Diplodia seriata]|uniref:Myb-like domain-containing protein n=3 Tax=Diplodia TaxID=66735 RepID=A0ABR3CUR5_9PEZI
MEARKSGLSWKPIAAKHFPNKTSNACRKRHERLMEQQNAQDLDGVKLEVLAREYMNVRKEMWSILAERVGEKWATVEAKCMERGLKNLQAAHRAGQRKERNNYDGDSGRGNYYEGDSGIGYSDAENEVEDYSSEAGPSHGGAGHQQPQPSPTGGGFHTNQRGGPSIQSMLSPEPHPGYHAPQS